MFTEARVLSSLAWPVVLGQLGFRLLGVTALFVLGGLGETTLGALGAATTWSIATLIVAIGILQGFDPLFSQAHGAGDARELGRNLARALALCVVVALPVSFAHANAEPALRWLGQPEAVLPGAAAWCRAMSRATIPALWFFAVRGFLVAQGLTRVPALAMVAANVVNLLGHLALLQVDGLSPERAVYLSGCCTAAVYCVLPLAMVALAPAPFRAALAEARGAWDPGVLLAMLRLGLPAGLQLGLEVWAFNLTTLLMGRLGSSTLAGHVVALNIASIAFMVPLGLGVAVSARVGNQIGAGRGWVRSAKVALFMAAAFAACSGTLFAVAPGWLASMYTRDGAVLAVAIAALPFAALFQLFDGAQAVSFGVLRGAGDLRVPALANLVGHWILGVPLGYYLAFHTDMGFLGMWAGLTVGLGFVTAILLVRIVIVARRGVTRLALGGQPPARSATVDP